MSEPRTFSIPLRHPFRGLSERRGIVFSGRAGWGEVSPFPDYPGHLVRKWEAAAIEAAFLGWPPPIRTQIPVNVTVPAVGAREAHALVAASGCTTAKVKVGDEDGEARVEAVRDALGPAGRIRIDANGAWSVDEAAAQVHLLSRYDLEYAEQPVATVDEMARLRRLVDVPLAADESIRLAGDPMEVVKKQAADIAVLKVHPLGGVAAALDLAARLDMPCVVSSALETSVGMAAGVALASALPELPYACGLGTGALFEGDLVADPFLPVDGYLEVRRPSVDEELLSRWELPAGPERDGLIGLLSEGALALSASLREGGPPVG